MAQIRQQSLAITYETTTLKKFYNTIDSLCRYVCSIFFFPKMGLPGLFFVYFGLFKQYIFCNKLMWKMSIQYPVLGFNPFIVCLIPLPLDQGSRYNLIFFFLALFLSVGRVWSFLADSLQLNFTLKSTPFCTKSIPYSLYLSLIQEGVCTYVCGLEIVSHSSLNKVSAKSLSIECASFFLSFSPSLCLPVCLISASISICLSLHVFQVIFLQNDSTFFDKVLHKSLAECDADDDDNDQM